MNKSSVAPRLKERRHDDIRDKNVWNRDAPGGGLGAFRAVANGEDCRAWSQWKSGAEGQIGGTRRLEQRCSGRLLFSSKVQSGKSLVRKGRFGHDCHPYAHRAAMGGSDWMRLQGR